jgi:hypothetical protein
MASLDGAPDAPQLNGKIRRITSSGVEVLPHKGDPDAAASPIEPAEEQEVTPEALIERALRLAPPVSSPEPLGPTVGFHPVYYTPRQSLIGSGVSDGGLGASSQRGIFSNSGFLQGEAARRYDENCLEGCASILAAPFGGLLYFPISFSTIVHRPTRELYLPVLNQLPARCRDQLAASVYDVPRDPSFTAMTQLIDFLRQYFGVINLGVLDPGFQVEKLGPGLVNSVTLVLTESDPKARLSAVRRFMDNRDHYKRREIWQGIGHIRTRPELEFCIAQRAPFLSGPAVSDLLDAPAKIGSFPAGGRRDPG